MALRSVALSCLVLLLPLASFVAVATSKRCQYIVRVQTGGRDGAGTDSVISLKLMSSSGSSFTVDSLQDWGIMAAGHDYFERDNLDIFSGKGTCLGVCAINVTSNGEGDRPGWYLEFVEITVCGGVFNKVAFPAKQWLALDTGPKRLYANVDLCFRPF